MQYFIKYFNTNFLKRTTSSGKVLAELDGLRALAIFMVIYFHTFGFFNHQLPAVFNKLPQWLNAILKNGDNGVPLFFAISSFVLGIPFARHHLFKAPKVCLKKYFTRRVTRLQPTYFIVLLVFGMYYFFSRKYNLSTLLQSFVVSNLYLHNIIFNTGSFINYVAWSLEIEFQFYLLLPLLALIFKLPTYTRRIILTIGILSGTLLSSWLNQFAFLSLLNYYHYFLAGLLCLDFYLSSPKLLKNKNIAYTLLGFVSLILIISQSPHHPISIHLIPFASGLILLLALQNPFWNKLFSQTFLSHTGTMSYSMYLIHFQVIAFGGIGLVTLFKQTESHILLLLGILLLFIIIWFCSALAFVLIEKPFMNPNWYKIKK